MVIVGNEFETKEKKFQPRMDSFTTWARFKRRATAVPISKIRLYQRDGSCATFETKSFYCRALRGSCPLEFFIVVRPKNTQKNNATVIRVCCK